jgi:histidine decarboxylase
MTAAIAVGADPRTVLAERLSVVKLGRRYEIGFPGATDITYPELAEWLCTQLLNNVGDPYDQGHGRDHSKDLERQVVTIVADLLHAPPTRWGYITGGASEGTEHALDDAVRRYPDVVVYTSAEAHPSVAKAARRLRLPMVVIRCLSTGAIDVADLAAELGRRRDRAAMIVATAGTTMTEAVDDVAAIAAACEQLAIRRRRIHVDAALAGIPLSLLAVEDRPPFDFAAGADSMVVSGHKFLSTLMPCGILVYAEPPLAATAARNRYTGSADTTIGCSRSGHTPLLLWTSLTLHGAAGHAVRADTARDTAAYTLARLRGIGWPAWRNPQAFTVVMRTPPPAVLAKWVLATDGPRSHIVTMPGITRDQIDEFVDDLRHAAPATRELPVLAATHRPQTLVRIA